MKRPANSPTAIDPTIVELIVNLRVELTAQGLDAGPNTIAWHLQHHHRITVSVATIRRRLVTAGLVVPEPKKRPKASYIRFAADLPNECWHTPAPPSSCSIDDLDLRVINTTTGELLRHLTLDPTRGYQPRTKQ